MSSELTFHHRYQAPIAGSHRTLLVLHGTGGDENSLFPIASVLDPNAGVLSVRGKVLENGAPRFFRRIEEGVFDMEDLHFRTQELAAFLKNASAAYSFDLKHLFAAGYSNGANIASSLLFSRPEVLAGAILFRAMVPFEPDDTLDLTGKHVLISEGKYDPIVPLEDADLLAVHFQDHGADVTLRWTELDHRLGRDEINRASEWLADR